MGDMGGGVIYALNVEGEGYEEWKTRRQEQVG